MNGTSATTTATDAGLFGDELISPEVAKALPEGYKIRALRQSDFKAGFLDCLRVLTTVGDITEEAFAERFAWLSRQDGGYYILVIEDGGRVVGTGALIVERKLYVASPPSQSHHVHGPMAHTKRALGVEQAGQIRLYFLPQQARSSTHANIFRHPIAFTTSAWSDTSRISPSQRTSRARSWACA